MNGNFENQNVQPVEQPVQPIQSEATPVQPVAPTEPMAQPEMQPFMQQPAVQPIEPEVKKKKNIVPIIILIALIVLVGGGVAAYFLFFGKVTGKQVIDGTIGNLFSKAVSAGTSIQDRFVVDYKNDIVNAKGNLVVNGDIKYQGSNISYKDIAFTYDTKVNLKDLEGSFKLSTSQEEKKILNLDGFIQNKKAYVNSSLFEVPYLVDLTDQLDWKEIENAIKDMPEFKSDGYKKLSNKTVKYLQNAIKEEYITQTEGNFTIEGKSISGLKNTVNIDESRRKTIIVDFMNQIKADEEYVKLVADYSGKTVEDVKKAIDDYLDSISNGLYNKNEMVISIYTTSKGEFLALEYSSGSSAITAVSDNDITTVRVKENGKETYKFTYNQKEKEFTFMVEEYECKVQFITNGIKFSVSGDGLTADLSITDETKESSLVGTLEANVNYVEGKNTFKGSVKYNSEVTKVTSIDTFATSSAKPVEEMTQEEYMAIMTKLSEAATGTYIESIMNYLSSDIYTTKYDI